MTVEDIEFREIKGEEYVYVTKEEVGQAVEAIVPGVVDVLKSLTFPVSMHWAGNSFEYIRPVHTLTVLLDEQEFDLDFLISREVVSCGHRFWGKKPKFSQH